MVIYKLGRFAERDLDEIWLYIAQDDPTMAETFMRELSETFWMLAENPMAGRARSDLCLNLRFFPCGDYCIYYYPEENGIRILRVLHSARNVESIFD